MNIFIYNYLSFFIIFIIFTGMNVYLDKQYFHTVQDLFHTAMIENTRLQDITNDIIVSNEYKEILNQKME